MSGPVEERRHDVENRPWDEQLSEYLKRTGQEIRAEAEKWVKEVVDSKRRERIFESLKQVSQWAKSTAEDVSEIVGSAAQEAEGAFAKAAQRVGDVAHAVQREVRAQKRRVAPRKKGPARRTKRAAKKR